MPSILLQLSALPKLLRALDSTTTLLLGLLLQSALITCLPFRVALIPAVALLAARLVKIGSSRPAAEDYLKGILQGRFTAQFPHADGSAPKSGAEEGVVVFVIGGSVNQ